MAVVRDSETLSIRFVLCGLSTALLYAVRGDVTTARAASRAFWANDFFMLRAAEALETAWLAGALVSGAYFGVIVEAGIHVL